MHKMESILLYTVLLINENNDIEKTTERGTSRYKILDKIINTMNK